MRSALRWYHVAIVLAALLWVTGMLGCAHFRANPWTAIGAHAELTVMNETPFICPVALTNSNNQIWQLGAVAPADSVTWQLPFADERVRVSICGHEAYLDVDQPKRYRLTAYLPSKETP